MSGLLQELPNRSPWFQPFLTQSPATHNQIGPFWCWFPGGRFCVRSRTLWVSPTNSPVRLEVSPTATSTPTGVFNQRLEALFPCWNSGLLSLSRSPVGLSAPECRTTQSTIFHLARSSPPACLSLPLLLVWMNISSLTLWLSDFHTVWFSVSSSCFLFLNCCCPSFGCGRRHSVSTYTSILAGSWMKIILTNVKINLNFLLTHSLMWTILHERPFVLV